MTKGWISHSFPGNIEKTFPDFDGIVWGRKTVDIPEQWEGKPLSLHMGYVDDEDITYFNGIGDREHVKDILNSPVLYGNNRVI